jgi:hypothetical protein
LFQQQQEAIILLLGDHSAERVAQIIAQPPPLGFALKTTDASIIRFRSRFIAAKCAAARQNDEQALADLLAEAHQSDAGFQNVIQRLIKDRLVRAAGQQHFSLGVLDSLLTSLIKFRKQSLAERKQTHAEKQ